MTTQSGKISWRSLSVAKFPKGVESLEDATQKYKQNKGVEKTKLNILVWTLQSDVEYRNEMVLFF